MATKRSMNIVMDEKQTTGRSGKKKNSDRHREMKPTDILQQQHIKEKQLLKQWKLARGKEKKTQLIVRGQSRDMSRGAKECFTKIDGPYTHVIDTEAHYIWKHADCNVVCKAGDCIEWILDHMD
jgi:hypothetical protein